MHFGEPSAFEPDPAEEPPTRPADPPATQPLTETAMAAGPAAIELDLDAVEQDLADVETALGRLESGAYWTCEITGQPLSDELLTTHPTARRLPSD